VGCYCRALARMLGLDHEFAEALFLASPLHDIGKIGIPDRILLTHSRLSHDEWEVMKRHCAVGAEILREDSKTMRTYLSTYGDHRAPQHKCSRNPILRLASSIALTHHEWWDGTGYPPGLGGHAIPLAARIVALADTYDALRSEQPYKPALSEDEAVETIRGECGSHLEPEVGAAFERSLTSFRPIHNELSDPPSWAVEAECAS
jgi:HD-GYP domain-containing protein (c-di-GMP phosphodiesterase class II)